jgi:hypothetical protein
MLESTSRRVKQLRQLTTITRDDELISPSDRDVLWKAGLVSRMHGWNLVTEVGIDYLMSLGLLEHGLGGGTWSEERTGSLSRR